MEDTTAGKRQTTSAQEIMSTSNITPGKPNRNPSGKKRGYDELKPFLHEVNKIVAEECVEHMNVNDIPWYATWENGLRKGFSVLTLSTR